MYNGTEKKLFWTLYGGSGDEGSSTYAYNAKQVAYNNIDFLAGSLKTVTNATEYADLTDTLNAFTTNGAYTCPAAGIAMANAVLQAGYVGNETQRDRIVLLFTDGTPNLDLGRGHNVSSARNDAVKQAYIAKSDYDATVFSVYTSTVEPGDANRYFLRVTSSMYPEATHYAVQDANGDWSRDSAAWGPRKTDKNYCFQATNENDLKIAFTSISESMSTPATNLDDTAVLRDVLSDYFDLRDASGEGTISIKDIQVFTAKYLGGGAFAEPIPFTTAKVEFGDSTITEDLPNGEGRLDSISVSGFSYVNNFVHDATTEQPAGGQKLIVKIPIKVRDGFWGGNSVPTNEDAGTGLYSVDKLGMTKVTGLPLPKLNVQVYPVVNTRSITAYYGGSASWADILTGITVSGVPVNYAADSNQCSPAEAWMDDYATMIWSGYKNIIDTKTPKYYSFAALLSSRLGGTVTNLPIDGSTETMENPKFEAKSIANGNHVHILTPEIAFQDSTIRMGDTAGDYDLTNLVQNSLVWKNEQGNPIGSSDVVVGDAPTLTLTYSPVEGAFNVDTQVNVTVTSSNGNENITDIVTFLWSCNQSLHDVSQNIPTHKGSENYAEFWIHVSETTAVDDRVVIDFGLSVKIDVLENDVKPEGFTLVGIGTTDPGVKNGTVNQLTGSALTGTFGSVKVEDGKLVYTLNTMQMDGCDEFYYAAQYGDRYFYGKVTVIPATNIYFEDDFAGGVTYEAVNGEWQVAGTASSGTQMDDRPGTGNNYGYDDAYQGSAAYSMGTAHYLTVDADTYGTAAFTFCGTGFDIISKTSTDTGFITVKVYKGTDTTAAPMRTLAVDTYYSQTGDGLYQIPVMKLENLEYGQYTVVIKSAYNTWLDHNKDDASYQFYLDAIRIYDPVKDKDTNDVVNGAYNADKENYPIYEELRDLLIQAGSFGSLTVESEGTTTQVGGMVFIDSDKELSIENYANEGPNNEVYLKPGQSIAFNLNKVFINANGDPILPADVQVGMKAVSGSASFELYNPGTKVSTEENASAITSTTSAAKLNSFTGNLTTATEMYYSISLLSGSTIVITNTAEPGSEAILSITNLKFTFDEKAQIAETAQFDFAEVISISEADAVCVLKSLSGYSQSITVEKVDVPEPDDGNQPGDGGEANPGDGGVTNPDDGTVTDPDGDDINNPGGNENTPDDDDKGPGTGDVAVDGLLWVLLAALCGLALLALTPKKLSRQRGGKQ